MSFTALHRLTTLSTHITRTPISTRYFTTTQTAKIGSSISTPNMTADVKSLVDKAIADNKVVVFSKTYCPVSFAAETFNNSWASPMLLTIIDPCFFGN